MVPFFIPADLPPVKPSAIALGTIFTHTASLAILAPVFGDTYNRAQSANSKEEFVRSKEAAGAAAAWGSSLVGSAIQTYGVGALINATGTLSYKGAAYLGSLIFMASSAPSVSAVLEGFFLLFCFFAASVSRDAMVVVVGLMADVVAVVVRVANLHGEAPHGYRRCRCPRSRLRDRRPEHVPHLVGNPHQPVRLNASFPSV